MKRLDPTNKDSIEICLLMSVGFLGFLRLSELLQLRKSDIRIDREGLMLTIRASKTDQTGRGAQCFIQKTDRSYDATICRIASFFLDVTAQ